MKSTKRCAVRRRPAAPSLLAFCVLLLAQIGCAPKPASIHLSSPKMTIYGLKRGGTIQAEVLDKKGLRIPDAAVKWDSSMPKIATIEPNGLVKSASAGVTTFTASFGELSAKVRVDVIDVASITIAPLRSTLTGGKGAKTSFTAEVKDSAGKKLEVPPVWSSTLPAIATIDSSGTVTAVSEGRTGIVASLGEMSAPADLSVVFRELASFEVTPAMIILKSGDSQKLNVVARDGAGTAIEDVAVVWSSDDPKTAVATGGLVKGLSAGSAKIMAVCGPRTVTISIVVLP